MKRWTEIPNCRCRNCGNKQVLQTGFPIVLKAYTAECRETFWNGFMWADWNK